MFLAWFHVPVTVTEWLWERYGICKMVSTSVTTTNRGHNFLYDIVAWSIRHDIISSKGTTQTTDTTWCVHQATSVVNVETTWYLGEFSKMLQSLRMIYYCWQLNILVQIVIKNQTHSQTVISYHGSHITITLWLMWLTAWMTMLQWKNFNNALHT